MTLLTCLWRLLDVFPRHVTLCRNMENITKREREWERESIMFMIFGSWSVSNSATWHNSITITWHHLDYVLEEHKTDYWKQWELNDIQKAEMFHLKNTETMEICFVSLFFNSRLAFVTHKALIMKENEGQRFGFNWTLRKEMVCNLALHPLKKF